MNTQTLLTRYREHTGKISDKWSIYLDIYQQLFLPYTSKPVTLLEIGIQNGGSLEIWSRHFPHGTRFVGCDINPNCANLVYDDARISLIVADANSDVAEHAIAELSQEYDIVIDDGSHTSRDIVHSFMRYFKRVKEGGIFLAEDLHCSYWKEFDGGLFDPQSSISFFKRLVDILNFEHWGIPGGRTQVLRDFFEKYGCEVDNELLSSIHSVEFFNSVCVVRKSPAGMNELGMRIFAGQSDLVSSERLSMPAGKASPPVQTDNPWSDLSELSGERRKLLTKRLEEQSSLIQQMRADVEASRIAHAANTEVSRAAHAAEIQASRAAHAAEMGMVRSELSALQRHKNALEASWSWRLTRPLRYFRRLLG